MKQFWCNVIEVYLWVIDIGGLFFSFLGGIWFICYPFYKGGWWIGVVILFTLPLFGVGF
jgi:hypothetical protein